MMSTSQSDFQLGKTESLVESADLPVDTICPSIHSGGYKKRRKYKVKVKVRLRKAKREASPPPPPPKKLQLRPAQRSPPPPPPPRFPRVTLCSRSPPPPPKKLRRRPAQRSPSPPPPPPPPRFHRVTLCSKSPPPSPPRFARVTLCSKSPPPLSADQLPFPPQRLVSTLPLPPPPPPPRFPFLSRSPAPPDEESPPPTPVTISSLHPYPASSSPLSFTLPPSPPTSLFSTGKPNASSVPSAEMLTGDSNQQMKQAVQTLQYNYNIQLQYNAIQSHCPQTNGCSNLWAIHSNRTPFFTASPFSLNHPQLPTSVTQMYAPRHYPAMHFSNQYPWCSNWRPGNSIS